jgi:alpha-N-arabinofuranosidase
VNPDLFAKFSEHLGNNIYQGMEAEILFNPTFGEWHFRADERRPSGGFVSENDHEKIRETVEAHGRPLAYPESTDTDALLEAYHNALAFGWLPADDVQFSPDTGPAGNRAQRIETESSDAGVYQRTRLPLHRTNGYEYRCKIRSVDGTPVRLQVRTDDDEVLVEESLDVDADWEILEGTVQLPSDDLDDDAVYRVGLVLDEPGNVVVERLLLYPDDHLDYSDPEVIEFLRDSDLPLLRWPGGNFVSGYDWRDGIGPVDERPERINPAWGGLEPNLFGIHEFVQFCEHVGCEPTICVNAGDGTPEEAAEWVEYCNGDPEETEMGALRAEHGHPEPFDITYWELGNELYGPWQVHWTTPEGNADRFERFREAVLEVDPDVKVTATGQWTNADEEWNETLLDEVGEDVRAISEHILAGGQVDADTDPDQLFEAFMGYSEQLGEQFRDLEQRMYDAGVDDPRLDITELQLFAGFQSDTEGMGREADAGASGDQEMGLTPETMPTPVTISEALYNATIRHECMHMGEYVELLTHSATVNHGGGLWKQGERVWANPCHYGRKMGTSLAGGTPVGVDLESDVISTDNTFREIDPVEDVPAVDVMAVHHEDEDRLDVMLVNRTSGTGESTSVTVDTGDFDAAAEATVETLAGESMHEQNSRSEPERVTPTESTTAVEDGEATVNLDEYSMALVTFESS